MSLVRAAFGRPAAPDRILCFSIWFKGHNNPVVAELVERMERVDTCVVVFPRQRLLRFLALRAYRVVRPRFETWLLGRAAQRWRGLLAVDPEHLARFPGPAVAMMDDVVFDAHQAGLLDRPNVKAYVVTREVAGRRFRELGVETPYAVVPQATPLGALDTAQRDELVRDKQARGRLVIGYHASHHLTAADRGGANRMYNVDHLLELWEQIRPRLPDAELWLLGTPGSELQKLCAGFERVVLVGRKPRDQYLAWVAANDIGLYPRTSDEGIQAAKIADYLGCGVPVVAYDYDVVRDDLGPTGAGVLVPTPEAFVDAVVALAEDPERRARIAEASARAGAARDWSVLQHAWAAVLDEHLPRA